MRIAVVDPDPEARREVVAFLERCGIAVASFSDPRLALLFVLGKLDELDGVLVNDDCGRSSWLRSRLEILSVAPPVLTYSGSHPDQEARIADERAAARPPPCPAGALAHG